MVGGDRGAVVWLDEYGPGLAHPHTLLDLGSDRPRRFFSAAPLRTAWETRVPGLSGYPQTQRDGRELGNGVASACLSPLGATVPDPGSWWWNSYPPAGPLPEEAQAN